nr:hypothetical protein 3 [Mute swan feces associated tombus-like virus 6]
MMPDTASGKPQASILLSSELVRRHCGPLVGMAPKRKPRASTSRQPTGRSTGRRQNTPRRRAPTSSQNTPAAWTEWFVGWSGSITASHKEGVLDAVSLHPQTLHSTPYAAALAHHTHRRELAWEMRAHCTSATTTGVRFGFMVLPDPSPAEGLTTEMMWSAIENGMGVMVSSAGLGTRQQTFRVRSATPLLSNAMPAATESHLGYAAGVMIIYLLDAPMGLQDGNSVQAVFLLRCLLKPENPVPGFALLESNYLNHPRHQPGPPDWQLAISYASSYGTKFMDGSDSNTTSWITYHTGNIPLAGGYYWSFAGVGGDHPTASATVDGKTNKVLVRGQPKYGCVYMCSADFPPWRTNRNTQIAPRFFAVTRGWLSGKVYMIGFVTQTQAANQVDGKFTMIPPQAELCIRYNSKPVWSEFHPQTSNDQCDLSFWSVYTSSSTGDIYKTSTPVAGSYSLSAMALESPEEYFPPPPSAPDWSEEEEDPEEGTSEQARQSLYPTLPSSPYAGFTEEELAEQYARAVQLVSDLEDEHQRRQPQPERQTQATQAGRSGSIWDLLKSSILGRRKYLE